MATKNPLDKTKAEIAAGQRKADRDYARFVARVKAAEMRRKEREAQKRAERENQDG